MRASPWPWRSRQRSICPRAADLVDRRGSRDELLPGPHTILGLQVDQYVDALTERATAPSLPQPLRERSDGVPAMADLILLSIGELGHSPMLPILFRKECGVVSETARPASLA
jgi:hypothetical protein